MDLWSLDVKSIVSFFSTNLLGSDHSYVHFNGACKKIMSMLLFLQITHGWLSRKASYSKEGYYNVATNTVTSCYNKKMIITSTDSALLNIQFIERFVVIYLFWGIKMKSKAAPVHILSCP